MTVGEIQSENRALEKKLREVRADREAVERELREERAGNAALHRLVRELRLEIAVFTAIPAKSVTQKESQTQFYKEISCIPAITVFGTLRKGNIAIEKLQNCQFISVKKLEIDTFSRKSLKCETFHLVEIQKKVISPSIKRENAIEVLTPMLIAPAFAAISKETHDLTPIESRKYKKDCRTVESLPGLRLLSVPRGKLTLEKGPYLGLIPGLKAETFPLPSSNQSLCISVLSPLIIPCSDYEGEACLELETCSLFTIYPETRADPELFSCSVCDLPPVEHDLAFSGFTVCSIMPPRPLEPDICRLTCCSQVIPTVPTQSLSLHNVPIITVHGFNYLQLFLELEPSTREETGQKRKSRPRPVRKDPGEEYFAMSLQVLKLNNSDCAAFCKASPAGLYAQALAEAVPFAQVRGRQWGKWLKRRVRAEGNSSGV